MDNFLNGLTNQLKGTGDFNMCMTENGAFGYRTTGKELLDLNFQVASLRCASENDIFNRFMKAFYEGRMEAMKWLFYARDVRGGLGERRLFRVILDGLIKSEPEIAKAILELIPEYGRFDDLMVYINSSLKFDAIRFINKKLIEDLNNIEKNKPISLLGKWLPSINASSAKTRKLALTIINELGMTKETYRKALSKLRSYTNVVETYMSANRWNEINYEQVPSRANIIYKDAFAKHDPERRQRFLDAVSKGEAKIISATNFPHDIVQKYMTRENSYWGNMQTNPYDEALEQLWKALPNYVEGDDTTIVVADGSGSMTSCIGNTKVMALSVANALAIYFAERCSGAFKDKYITFSENPHLVNLSKGKNLRDKINIALKYNEVANTNIKAVFDLILRTAINNGMTQAELPKNILVISDMEFDSCARYSINSLRLFDEIAKKYENAGYKLPRLVFWNVNSRTKTIPLIQNDLGVTLVSGFSPTIVKMVLSNETDPYQALLDTINTDRYKPVEKALKQLL